ncbi:MAG: hypothetical protein ACLRXQ_04545 [Phascolarctobacterium faecium]
MNDINATVGFSTIGLYSVVAFLSASILQNLSCSFVSADTGIRSRKLRYFIGLLGRDINNITAGKRALVSKLSGRSTFCAEIRPVVWLAALPAVKMISF